MSEGPKRRVTVQTQQLCPLCKDLARAEVLVVCPRCETVYHASCVQEMAGGRCPTQGCASRASERRPAEPAAKPVSTDIIPYERFEAHVMHRLRGLEGDVLHFEPNTTGLLFAGVFAFAALVLGGGLLKGGAPWGLLFLPAMLGAMGLLSFVGHRKNQRHGLRAEFRRLEGSAQILYPRGTREIPIAEIEAVQFSHGYQHTFRREGITAKVFAFQLVLVSAGGQRDLLLTSGDMGELYSFAHHLSKWLDVPLLDSSEDEVEPVPFPLG